MVVLSAVLALLAATVITVALGMAKDLVRRWGIQSAHRARARAEAEGKSLLSKTDEQMIRETRRLLERHFDNDPVKVLSLLPKADRIRVLTDFARELAEAYGLEDVQVDVDLYKKEDYGLYYDPDRRLAVNVIYIMQEKDSEVFAFCVLKSVETVIHELRHAVQYKALREPGFWNIPEERTEAWRKNLEPGQYIRHDTDFRAYVEQPVEKDAFGYTARAMEEVVYE